MWQLARSLINLHQSLDFQTPKFFTFWFPWNGCFKLECSHIYTFLIKLNGHEELDWKDLFSLSVYMPLITHWISLKQTNYANMYKLLKEPYQGSFILNVNLSNWVEKFPKITPKPEYVRHHRLVAWTSISVESCWSTEEKIISH